MNYFVNLTDWSTGDVISKEKLNSVNAAIETSNYHFTGEISGNNVTLDGSVSYQDVLNSMVVVIEGESEGEEEEQTTSIGFRPVYILIIGVNSYEVCLVTKVYLDNSTYHVIAGEYDFTASSNNSALTCTISN